MAAPARPGVSEARVACPVCGGFVHPVAGRCKHCKTDLSTFRGGRPQAATPLPALQAPKQTPPAGIPAPVLGKAEESQPILPPRESMSMPAARDERTRGTWARRWPLFVIVIAGVAIVGAMVVMFWLPPGDSSTKDEHGLPPPPAPERMRTDPLPPPSFGAPQAPNAPPPAVDPWGPSPGGHAQIRPQPNQVDPFAGNPTGNDPFNDPNDPNIYGGLLGSDDLNGGFGIGTGFDYVSLGTHACARLAQCGKSNPASNSYCNLLKAFPHSSTPPTCEAAKKCLARVDSLDCSTRLDDDAGVAALMTTVPDCLEAMTSC